MIKEQNKIFLRVQIISDLCLVVISFLIGYYLRDRVFDILPGTLTGDLFREERVLRPIGFYLGLLPIVLIIWGALLSYFGMYKSSGLRKVSETLIIVMKTTLAGFVLFGSYVFIFRMQQDVSRLFLGLMFISAAIFIVTEKIILLYLFKRINQRGIGFKSSLIGFRSILIVGINQRSRQFMKLINKNPDWGIRIIGVLDIAPVGQEETAYGCKVLGSINDIQEVINRNIVDEVIFIVPRSSLDKIEDTIMYCENAGLKINLAVDLFDLKFSRPKQTDLRGFPLITYESTPDRLGHLFIKRVLDFVISGMGLVLLAPLYMCIVVIIKVSSKGPVFFNQERCSMYGRRFILYKFRTMVADAETKQKDLLDYNEMNGPVFKMTNDPRVTGVGKWLRKFSLDELPQLWNVLKGDMSLVGPRPPLPSEVYQYDNWHRRKLSMRPGITCLWQVSGRSEIADFDEWMRLDLEYIDRWSFGLDFKILIKTIPMVLFGIGAK
jgi:exopolysaccharide biosynthesis polyprenyl glycosylphosphotransferase